MDLLLSTPTNTGENHIITNVQPRISANTTFTIKKTTVCTRRLFSAQICLISTDLTNKLRILLSVSDFANYAKFVFSWPAWVVYGFAISTKGSKPYGRKSICYHGPHILRNVVGVAKIIKFILKFFPCNKCYGQSKRYNWHLANVSITTVIIFSA